MPGENIQDWSITASLNGNIDSSINWAEGQPRASVNNSARSMMAAHAKQRNLLNGSILTFGTANAQQFFSGLNYTVIPPNLRVMLKIGPDLTNTAAATLDMDNLGPTPIKNQLGLDIAPGTLRAGGFSEFIFSGTAWVAMAAAAGVLENIRAFTTSGAYPTTTSQCKVLVDVKGAGGGGGGSEAAGPRGGGGGEGEECWFLTTAAALSALAVTVGAGGSQGIDGAAGTSSSVGALIGAGGGSGGARGNFGGAGGVGGSGGIGAAAYRMPGAAGHCGADSSGTIGLNAAGGGKGGGGMFQSGAANSGGGGGCGTNVNSPGDGGSGVVVCYEYGII